MHGQRTALVCPRCATQSASPPPLFVGTASGVTLHACGACGGAFLGTACASRLASALPDDALHLAEQASRGARYDASTAAALHCPLCRAPMTRTLAARAGVELDVCPSHGTWYDRTEITRVAAAIRASGWGPVGPSAGITAGMIATGAAAAGVAGVALAQPSPLRQQVESTVGQTVQTVGEVAGQVIPEVGAEIVGEAIVEGAADGVFELVFGVLGAILE